MHLALAASTNDGWAIGAHGELATGRGGAVPDLDSEIFLSSFLQELGEEVVEPLGSVDAGEGGDAGVGHLVPVAPLPVQRARALRGGTKASLVTPQLVASLQVPPASSRKVVRVEDCAQVCYSRVAPHPQADWCAPEPAHL